MMRVIVRNCCFLIVSLFFACFMLEYISISVLKEEKEEIIEPKSTSLSLVMVGDSLIHGAVYADAEVNGGYDFKPMLEEMKPIISKYDLAFYNQETILGGKELGVSDYPLFNSPQEVGDAMIDAGFNLVSLASNHTIDYGERAVLSSRDYWNSKSNVLAVGSYASEEDRNEVIVREKNNITHTMLNYTYGTNGLVIPSNKNYLVNVWPVDPKINDVNKDVVYQNYK